MPTWLQIIIDVAPIALTAALIWATIVIGKHTEQLVRFEKRRQRRLELKRLLEIVQDLTKLDVQQGLGPVKSHLKELRIYTKYLEELDKDYSPAYVPLIKKLAMTADTVERGDATVNKEEIRRDLKELRDKLYAKAVHRLREELGAFAWEHEI